MNRETQEIQEWISEHFQDELVRIEEYPSLFHGKKIIDEHHDFVVVFYDKKKDRINYYFKPN